MLVAITAAVIPRPKPAEVPKEPDPREFIQSELRAGRSVTIVGENGLPKWYDWPLEAGILGKAANGDGTCTFQSIRHSLLELLTDPGIDSYKVSAEVRQNLRIGPGAKIGQDRDDPAESSVGFYQGGFRVVGRAGQGQGYALLALTFDEAAMAFGPRQPRTQALARLEHVGFAQDSVSLRSNNHDVRQFKFTPSALRPGPWRQISAVVDTDRVRTTWVAEPGMLNGVVELTKNQLQDRYDTVHTQLKKDIPAAEFIRPVWTPRRAIGIWCYCSSVSVRNVIITPITDSETR
jgi:hypothetical protein